MKITALILSLLLSFNVLASGISELEKNLDEYQYALTVEWDQKDQKFYEEKTQAFFDSLSEVMSQGVTKDEVILLAEAKMKDPKKIEALKLKLNLLSSQATSSEELASILRENSKDFYNRGASWDGEVTLYVGFGLFAAALIAYAVWWNIKYECVASEKYRDCDWVKDRNGRSSYECENKTRCTEWVERNPN